MIAIVSLLLAAVPYPPITGHLRDLVRAYEVHGQEEVPVGVIDLGRQKMDIPVVDVDKYGRPGIVFEGRTLFLKNSDVSWVGVPTVFCEDAHLAQRPSNDKLAATPGVSAGLGNGSQRCVPK